MIDTVLFDLDGTLLRMDQDVFVKTYFDLLCRTMESRGWQRETLMKVLWAGVGAMTKNDGTMTNEERFWASFEEMTGQKREETEDGFLRFYENEFQQVRKKAALMEDSAGVVRLLREKGYRVILATNPLFPRVATYSRIRWAGLRPEDFDWVTTYENSCYSKPSPQYYLEILDKVKCRAEQCLMVGNDTAEDMCAAQLGMQVYLVTDFLVDQGGVGTEPFPHGSLGEFRHKVGERLPRMERQYGNQ